MTENKIMYDYEEQILDLQKEMKAQIVPEDSLIQILRDKEPFKDTEYYPILDWYYSKEDMELIFEIDEETDSEEDIKELAKMEEEYTKDQPSLEEMKAKDCLKEMRKYNY